MATDTEDQKLELEAYSNAKQLAKKLVIDKILKQLNGPEFDIINFSHLLTQDDDGGSGANPLHGIFSQDVVKYARKFVIASELLDEFLTSSVEEPSTAIIEDPSDDELDSVSDDDFAQILEYNK